VRSSPVVPLCDPSLAFVNAGMNQVLQILSFLCIIIIIIIIIIITTTTTTTTIIIITIQVKVIITCSSSIKALRIVWGIVLEVFTYLLGWSGIHVAG